MPRLFQAAAKFGASATARRAGRFAFGEQPLLAAHFGEVAEIDGRRARRLAGLPHMGDREVEIAVRIGHQPEEIGRVRLARPDRQHLPARHLGFVRPALRPGGAGALDGRCDVDRRGGVWNGRRGHALLLLEMLRLSGLKAAVTD